MSSFDLSQVADRLRTAADRAKGIDVSVSATDLIFSRDGYGTGRSESVQMAAIFLQERDLVGEALDRLLGPAQA